MHNSDPKSAFVRVLHASSLSTATLANLCAPELPVESTDTLLGQLASDLKLTPHLLAIMQGLAINLTRFELPTETFVDTLLDALPTVHNPESLPTRYLRRIATDDTHGFLALLRKQPADDTQGMLTLLDRKSACQRQQHQQSSIELTETIPRMLLLLDKEGLSRNDWQNSDLPAQLAHVYVSHMKIPYHILHTLWHMIDFLTVDNPFFPLHAPENPADALVSAIANVNAQLAYDLSFCALPNPPQNRQKREDAAHNDGLAALHAAQKETLIWLSGMLVEMLTDPAPTQTV